MPQTMPVTLAAPPRAARLGAAGMARRQSILGVLPLVLLFYSFLFFSPEVALNAGGINLPTYRIAMLLLAIPAAVALLKRTGQRFNFIDLAVAISSFWIMLSFMLTYGPGNGLVRGGGIFVDTALSYLLARASISRFNDLRYLLLLLLPGLLFAGLSLVLESFSGQLLLRPAFASVFGAVRSAVTDGGSSVGLVQEVRLGFLRAYGPFGHPILAGVFMVSFLPLYAFSGLRSWPLFLGIGVALSGFFSLSSAAFLCLMIAIAAITIDYAKQYIPRLTWWTISGVMLLALLSAHLATQNGIINVLTRLTLTPHTASYRVVIWRYGWRTIENYPWFGIGYRSWERLSWMHDSVDAHFLLLGMRHGLLVPVLLTLAVIYGTVRLGQLAPSLMPHDRKLAIGINVAIIMLFIVAQTVTFYGSGTIALMAFMAILASAVSFAQAKFEHDKYVAHLVVRRTHDLQRQQHQRDTISTLTR